MIAWGLAAVLGAMPAAAAPGSSPDVELQLVERITRFVEWPPLLMPSADAPFVVCLWGEDTVGVRFEAAADHTTFKGRRVEVRRPALEALGGCHLVWVATSLSVDLDRLLLRTSGRPILTIATTPGYAHHGVLVNLQTEDGTPDMEINLAEVRRSGLVFSARLLRLATLVTGR